MARRIIDLSVSLQAGIASDPPGMQPRIEYVSHKEGALQLAAGFPGLTPADLPGGEGWAIEHVAITTHNGTHMDAPWHYRSRDDAGAPMATIDDIPLDWCFGPGVKLDFRALADGHVVTPAQIDAELARIGHALAPGDIVLVNTAAGARYGHDDYIDRGCGMGRAATLCLTGRGVRVMGTDAWSWDAPFSATRARYMRDRDASIVWEGHFAGAAAPYCQIEKLANLDQLPATGFDVISLPVKVHKGSGGWARPVAILRD